MTALRKCLECTLCCRLVPVAEGVLTGPYPYTFHKPAGVRCEFARYKGCGIYDARPMACRRWSCRWLRNEPGTEKLSRPDRSHYVIDPLPDYVIATNNKTGVTAKIRCIQIWCDPKHRDAHRDPALRDYLKAEARKSPVVGLVRYSQSDALVIWPPLHDGQEFREQVSGTGSEPEHDQHEVQELIARGEI